MSDIIQRDSIKQNVIRLSKLWRSEFDNFRQIYNKVEEGYNYLAAKQFSPSQIAWYKAQRRPTDVFNIVFPVFNNVLGDFYTNGSNIKVFPKAGGNYAIAEKIQALLEHYSYEGEFDFYIGEEKPNAISARGHSIQVWQKYASPVWFDISQTRVLKSQKHEKDEKHICPLQLDVIERSIELWSNPNDLVFSPFTGIGSEGVVSLRMGRRFVGAELKKSYFDIACRNLYLSNLLPRSIIINPS